MGGPRSGERRKLVEGAAGAFGTEVWGHSQPPASRTARSRTRPEWMPVESWLRSFGDIGPPKTTWTPTWFAPKPGIPTDRLPFQLLPRESRWPSLLLEPVAQEFDLGGEGARDFLPDLVGEEALVGPGRRIAVPPLGPGQPAVELDPHAG